MTGNHPTWLERAEARLKAIDAALPAGVTLAERIKAVDADGGFGGSFPHKQWLKARRRYLGRHGYRGRGATAAPLPIEAACAGQAAVRADHAAVWRDTSLDAVTRLKAMLADLDAVHALLGRAILEGWTVEQFERALAERDPA